MSHDTKHSAPPAAKTTPAKKAVRSPEEVKRMMEEEEATRLLIEKLERDKVVRRVAVRDYEDKAAKFLVLDQKIDTLDREIDAITKMQRELIPVRDVCLRSDSKMEELANEVRHLSATLTFALKRIDFLSMELKKEIARNDKRELAAEVCSILGEVPKQSK